MSYHAVLKNPYKKTWMRIRRRMTLISPSLTTDRPTSVVKFSWTSVRWFLRKVANRQTDRQTDGQTNKRRALHKALGRRNETDSDKRKDDV